MRAMENEMDFRAKIIELITEQGKKSGKVLSGMNLRWVKKGDRLILDGFSMRYKFLPEKKTKESSAEVSLNPGKTLSV